MATASSILQLALTKMGRGVYYGTTATGGSNSTFVDTKMGTTYSATDLLNGSCIVTRDAGGAGAAPEGEYARISSYDGNGTGTIQTLAGGNLSAAIASGDTIMVVLPRIPLVEMIRALNETLQSFGRLPTWNPYNNTRYPGARGSYHAAMYAFGDAINSYLSEDLVATKLARQLYFYVGITEHNREEFNKLTSDLIQAEQVNPIWPDRRGVPVPPKVAR
jgi:hypothetical protein